jgi:YVTN family beta-propeller protein
MAEFRTPTIYDSVRCRLSAVAFLLLIVGSSPSSLKAQEVAGDSSINNAKPPSLQIVGNIGLPALPVGMVFSPNGKFLYAGVTTNTLEVIDTSLNTVIATIPAGIGNLAITPDGSLVFDGNILGNNTVSVVSTATNSVVANISVGPVTNDLWSPTGMAITPDGSQLYVADSDGIDEHGHVSVIDIASLQVVKSIPVLHPGGLVIEPKGKYAYVMDGFRSYAYVSKIDIASEKKVATDLGLGDLGKPGVGVILISPDGKILYVPDNTRKVVAISAVDGTLLKDIGVIPLPTKPRLALLGGLALSPDGRFLYVLQYDVPHHLIQIDTRTNQAVGSLPLVQKADELAMSPDGNYLYVASEAAPEIIVIAISP